MDNLFILGALIGLYSPMLLMIYWTVRQVHKRNANKDIDAKRRETFKVVKEE